MIGKDHNKLGGRFLTVKTDIFPVLERRQMTLNALSITLVNQGGIAVTINKNLVLEPGDSISLPYAQGTINRTVLEIDPNGAGVMNVVVLSTELSE